MIRRILTGLFIFALIIAAAFFGNRRMGHEAAPTIAREAPQPGYAARDAELIETGDDGQPLYTVNADVIRQDPERKIVNLETVRVDYRGEASNQWALSARHDTLREDTDAIELSGDVHIVGMPPRRTDLAQIFTEKLTYDPHAQIARTDAPVRVQMSNCEMTTTGLIANLKDQTLRLESHIHGSCS